jgi:hypothetical protein
MQAVAAVVELLTNGSCSVVQVPSMSTAAAAAAMTAAASLQRSHTYRA